MEYSDREHIHVGINGNILLMKGDWNISEYFTVSQLYIPLNGYKGTTIPIDMVE